MSIDFIFKKCPNCSASLEFIPGSKMGQCEFCGSSFLVSTLRTDKGEKSDMEAMELEDEESTTMNVPFITANSNGPLHICEEYTRSDMK